MIQDELAELIAQYRSGIEAELTLLHQLAAIARRQRDVTDRGDIAAFGSVADERDRLMRNLVAIETGLRVVRHALTEHRDLAARIDGFDEAVERHRQAATLAGAILSTDQASLSALADAELARRSVVASLERGEATLAAYRRVLSPPTSTSTLLDRRG